MAIDHIRNVKISAVCCAVPDSKLTVDDFYQMYDNKEVLDKFINDTSVKQIFYSKKQKTITSDLCLAAAEEIFSKKGIDKNSIDALIFVTQTSDYNIPATACTLQYRLGLSKECIAYDVNLGCSGYVYGLYLAAMKLQSGYLKKVLLLVGDVQKDIAGKVTDLNNFLFGDCGSATLIEYEEGAPGFRFALQTIGSGFEAIGATKGLRYAYVDNPKPKDKSIHMDGLSVFTFSISEVPRLFKKFCENFDANMDEYDTVLLHQANKKMLTTIAKKLKVDMQKVPLSIEWYGNTSSATIPNAMCYHYAQNNSDEKIKIIMSGFGIGLSLGVTDAYVRPCDILPIIQTDITWDEGRRKVLEANAKSS
ncbi:MAG: ketoacyl-ACP synthase III [Campylobacter sp.]|nr:ketoacyl-ACP synthase III [Campylobacter sp.]